MEEGSGSNVANAGGGAVFRRGFTNSSVIVIELARDLDISERRKRMGSLLSGQLMELARSEYRQRRILFRTTPVEIDANGIGDDILANSGEVLAGKRDSISRPPRNPAEAGLMYALRKGYPVKLVWAKELTPCKSYGGVDFPAAPGIRAYSCNSWVVPLEPLAGPHCIDAYVEDTEYVFASADLSTSERAAFGFVLTSLAPALLI